MKTASPNIATRISRRAFTLVELMVATAVGVGLAGTVVLLLVQSATEQRNGFADTTVEEEAYALQSRITSCLRGMSATQGVTPNYTSTLYDSNGNNLSEYQSISVFYPTNGGYITASITYNAASGSVIYTPNVLTPSTQVVWMTNDASAVLTQFYFTTSFNLDGSQNNSLVNVLFQMNDNGFSQQTPNNNPASIHRNFSVQMRNDN
jgi:prepilin-type N-terminal cleavage/methylation domain-containing protein